MDSNDSSPTVKFLSCSSATHPGVVRNLKFLEHPLRGSIQKCGYTTFLAICLALLSSQEAFALAPELLPFAEHIEERFQFIVLQNTDEARDYIKALEVRLRPLLSNPSSLAEALGPEYLVAGTAERPEVVSLSSALVGDDLQSFADRLNVSVEVFHNREGCCAAGKGDFQAIGYVTAIQPAGYLHPNRARVQWDVKRHELSIAGTYDMKIFRRSDSVSGMSDLVGSAMLVNPFLRGPDWNTNAWLMALKLARFGIAFTTNRMLWISGGRFSAATSPHGSQFQFPSTEGELEKLYATVAP